MLDQDTQTIPNQVSGHNCRECKNTGRIPLGDLGYNNHPSTWTACTYCNALERKRDQYVEAQRNAGGVAA